MDFVGYVRSIFEIDGRIRYDINTLKNAFSFPMYAKRRKKNLEIGTVIEFSIDGSEVKKYKLYDLERK